MQLQDNISIKKISLLMEGFLVRCGISRKNAITSEVTKAKHLFHLNIRDSKRSDIFDNFSSNAIQESGLKSKNLLPNHKHFWSSLFLPITPAETF